MRKRGGVCEREVGHRRDGQDMRWGRACKIKGQGIRRGGVHKRGVGERGGVCERGVGH